MKNAKGNEFNLCLICGYGVCMDVEHVDFHAHIYGHEPIWDPDPEEVYWGTEIPAADEMLREHDTFVSLPDDDSYQMR